MTEKTNIALLCGGDSSEREISLKSACAIYGAISSERFNVRVYEVSKRPAPASTALRFDEARLDAEDVTALHAWWAKCGATSVTWNDLATTLHADGVNVAFSALHGGWGEDGTIQTLLQVAGIPFVGSPARASMVAMDKRLCKLLARDCGLTVARGALLSEPDAPPFEGPVVVKPNGGGSSVGVTILREVDGASFKHAVCAALADGSDAMVEEFVEGTEVTAAILTDQTGAHPLPVVEVVPHADFYDFKAKYGAGGSTHICPARLSEAATARVQHDALAIFEALGCRGVARADFLVTAEGIPYFLEINTLPGMTQTSLVPDAAKGAGITFEKLVEQLLADALQ